MLELHNVRMEPSNMRKKSKKTTKCEKRIVTWDVETIQREDEIVNCEKKLREPSIVTKVLSYVMLKQHNVRMELSNVRKKVREPPNMRKKLLHVILKLHNVRMKPSNVRMKPSNVRKK